MEDVYTHSGWARENETQVYIAILKRDTLTDKNEIKFTAMNDKRQM